MKNIIILLLISTVLLSQELIVSNENIINLTSESFIYIDKKSKKDINKLVSEDKLFKKSKYHKIEKGLTKDTYWFKLTLKNNHPYDINKAIYIDAPFFYKDINLYTNTASGITTIYNIDDTKDIQETLYPFFEITLKKEQIQSYYIKINSNKKAMNFSIFLLNKDAIYKKELKHQLILALFFGSIIAFIFYNLSLLFFTKDISYFYYVAYFVVLIMYYSRYSSMDSYLFNIQIEYTSIHFLSLIVIFIILFIRSFLHIYLYKRIDIVFKGLILIAILLFLVTSKEFYPITFATIILLTSGVLVLGISFYLLLKGVKEVKYFLLGWCISLSGYFALATYDYGFTLVFDIFPYFYELTIFMEALLFSMALSSRLNKTKELEQSVQKNDLLTRELHHRIKNNMQFIISIYRLNLSNYINPAINEKLINTENIIKAMSRTHEILYNQNDLEYLDMHNYFQYIIEELKKSFSFENIQVNYNIQTKLDISHSITCGIILNELITNTLKYAFKDNKGEININLKEIKNKIHFIIEDNGIGFNLKDTNQSQFGLVLINSLVKNELEGDILIDSTNRTKITIIF